MKQRKVQNEQTNQAKPRDNLEQIVLPYFLDRELQEKFYG
jgi:hypothetical protein